MYNDTIKIYGEAFVIDGGQPYHCSLQVISLLIVHTDYDMSGHACLATLR